MINSINLLNLNSCLYVIFDINLLLCALQLKGTTIGLALRGSKITTVFSKGQNRSRLFIESSSSRTNDINASLSSYAFHWVEMP